MCKMSVKQSGVCKDAGCLPISSKWLINRINRDTCSIKQAVLLNVLINTVTLILGLIILAPIAHVSY